MIPQISSTLKLKIPGSVPILPLSVNSRSLYSVLVTKPQTILAKYSQGDTRCMELTSHHLFTLDVWRDVPNSEAQIKRI